MVTAIPVSQKARFLCRDFEARNDLKVSTQESRTRIPPSATLLEFYTIYDKRQTKVVMPLKIAFDSAESFLSLMQRLFKRT